MKKIFLWTSPLLFFMMFANMAISQSSNSTEDYSALLPEVRAFNQLLSGMPKGKSLLTKEGLAAARKGLELDGSVKLTLTPTVKYIGGPAGKLGLRIFRPDTIRAVVLDFHGGGWSFGTAATDDVQNDEMANRCKVAVVSVDYRLAPEHPFPAGVNDCKAAAKWLLNNSLKEFGTDKLILSGGSAGAHLSALVALFIRDSLHALGKVIGMTVVFGHYDLARTPSNRLATDSTLLINKKFLEESFELVFHGWDKERLRRPTYSPLYADLKNMPTALFTVGTLDPLIDDTYFMEARWRLAGNKTYLAVYPECPHGFNVFPSQMARVANERIFKWIMELCEE